MAHFGRYYDSRQLSYCIMTRANNNKRGSHCFLQRWHIIDISMQPQFISDVVKWILELPRLEYRFSRWERKRERDGSSSVIHSPGSHPASTRHEAFHSTRASSIARCGNDYRLSILLVHKSASSLSKELCHRRFTERGKLLRKMMRMTTLQRWYRITVL